MHSIASLSPGVWWRIQIGRQWHHYNGRTKSKAKITFFRLLFQHPRIFRSPRGKKQNGAEREGGLRQRWRGRPAALRVCWRKLGSVYAICRWKLGSVYAICRLIFGAILDPFLALFWAIFTRCWLRKGPKTVKKKIKSNHKKKNRSKGIKTFIKVHKNTQNPLTILPDTPTYCTLS